MDRFGGLPTSTSQQPGQRPRSPRPTPTRTGLFVCLQFEGGRSTEEIRKFWQNYEHPSINKQEWSEQEVAQLKAVAAKHGHLDWQSIAEELGVRVTLRPGPALAAARGSAQATREGSWRVGSGHSGGQLEEVRGCSDHTASRGCPPKQPQCSACSVPFPSLTSCSGPCSGGLGRLFTWFLWVLFFLVS